MNSIAIPTPEELQQRVVQAYGSLTSPAWHFVQLRHDTRPYATAEAALRDHFEVADTTDLNDDVSLALAVKGTSASWMLWLSYVASVAAVISSRVPGQPRVIERAGDDPEESTLFELLDRAGLAVLPQATLEHPIDLTLSNTGSGRVKLFQALFGDYDILPWDLAAV